MQPPITIIILAFNRLYSLQRLMISLIDAARAFNSSAPIPITISLDADASPEVIRFSENIFSRFYTISIIKHTQKMGPDQHNLWAMQQSEISENVMILEDDTMVSPSLFFYSSAILAKLADDPQIAGFSLYDYERNEVANYPFMKLQDGNDIYYYQRASSRGMLLTKAQWLRFKSCKITETGIDLPEFYRRWDDSIWEKKFNAYLIQENKYWAFPRQSITTNFGEPGAHVSKSIYRHAFQSRLSNTIKSEYKLCTVPESKTVYDSYGEPTCIPGFSNNEITSDIFGIRNLSLVKTKYVLTGRFTSQSIEGYSLDLMPPEMNIIAHLRGGELKVTETQFITETYLSKLKWQLKLHYYFYPDQGLLHLLRIKLIEITQRILK